MPTTTDHMPGSEAPENKVNPLEAARFLKAYVECSRESQEIVIEMSEIIADESSTDDERVLAFDALMETLFPGTAADVLEQYHEILTSPEGAKAAAELKAEERGFSTRVRTLMTEKGVTQEQLAKQAGIGQPAVSNILNRRCRPQRRTIARFAEALGVTPEELWTETASDS